MLDYALRLLSYWSALCKIVVFFFLKFGFATGRVWREKNVLLAFLLSHTLRFYPHSRPFHSPVAHAFLTWAKIRAVLQSIWGVVLPD